MMEYVIDVTPNNDTFDLIAIVYDGDTAIIEGKTTVACETEAEAIAYAEDVFLWDLRVNNRKKISGLELPIDTRVVEVVMPEEPVEEPIEEPVEEPLENGVVEDDYTQE